jgi:hypothetical protein
MKCFKCGFELASSAKFCRSCGTPQSPQDGQRELSPSGSTLPPSLARANPDRLQCIKCGTELAKMAKFCKSCGTPKPIQADISSASAVTSPDALTLEATAPVNANPDRLQCVKCGTELAKTAKFCKSCGTPQVHLTDSPPAPVVAPPAVAVAPVPASANPDRLRCVKCGTELSKTAKFCKSCGMPRTLQADSPPESAAIAPAALAVEAVASVRANPDRLQCVKCGTELAKSAKFCKSCGTPQRLQDDRPPAPAVVAPAPAVVAPAPAVVAPAPAVVARTAAVAAPAPASEKPASLQCIKCGTDLTITAKFCNSCGTPRRVPDQSRADVAQTEAAPAKREPGFLSDETVAATMKNKYSATAMPKDPELESNGEALTTSASEAASAATSTQTPPVVVATVAASAPVPTPVPVPVRKSRAGLYSLVVAVLIAGAGGAGYWGWTQKVKADEAAALIAKQLADEQQRKDEEAQKLKAAEETGRAEAEAKAKADADATAAAARPSEETSRSAAAEQVQQKPAAQPQPKAIFEKASQCKSVPECVAAMLDSAEPRYPEAIQAGAAKLSEFNNAKKGDRRTARDLNKRGLEQFANSKLAEAVDLLRKAAVADPSDIEIASNLGHVLLQANRVDDAASVLANALMLDSRRTGSWISIAEFFVAKDGKDLSLRALLLAYEFSGNKEKTIIFYEDKAITADRVAMRPVYASAIQKLKQSAIR